MTEDRRQYSRIVFQAPARLVFSTSACDAKVLDLSLKGALVRLPADTSAAEGEEVQLHVRLGETEDRISMSMRVTHVEGRYAGLLCDGIDLDSVTHLRRLVELNLGNSELLDRELSSLIAEFQPPPEEEPETETPENT